MAYETCPQCGAQKHQLVACPQCGFKRMTTRPHIDRELLDDEEFPRPRHAPAAPVSSNFEACPHCGARKHLLMACPGCGFSRSGNPERLAHKPPTEPPKIRVENRARPTEFKPRSESRPRYNAHSRQGGSGGGVGSQDGGHARHEGNMRTYTQSHYTANATHDVFERDYAPSVERPAPQNAPVVRWKRSKVSDRGHQEG